ETEHHGIDGIGELADVDPLRHSGVEDSSAVQMNGKAGVVGDLAQGGSLRRAEAGSAFAIVGVLEAEKSGYRLVDIRQTDRAAYLIRLKAPVPAVQRSELKAADNRRARHFVLKDMAVDLEDDLLSGLGVAEQGAEVAHRPARNKERGFLADHLCGPPLQAMNRRVFIPDVVAHFRRGLRLPHRFRRKREGVAAQLYRPCHPSPL